jgi:hypothetical protein
MFFIIARTLRASLGFFEPGDFLFESLHVLLQAIGHFDHLFEKRHQLKLLRRQFLSCNVGQRELLWRGHDWGTWMLSAKQKLTSPFPVYKPNVLLPP